MKRRDVEEFVNGMVGLASEWMYEDSEGMTLGVRVTFYPSGVVEIHPEGRPLERYRCADATAFADYLKKNAFPVEEDRPDGGNYDPSGVLQRLLAANPDDSVGHVADECYHAITTLAGERDWLEGVLQDMQQDSVAYKLGYDEGRESAEKESLRKGRLDVLGAFPLGELSNADSYLLGMLRSQVGHVPHVAGFRLTPNLWSVRISTFISDIDVDTLTGLDGETRKGLELLQSQLRQYVDGDWLPF